MNSPLKNITAAPHASGNRIDLAWLWSYAGPPGHDGVLVLRGSGAYPVSKDEDGQNVAADIRVTKGDGGAIACEVLQGDATCGISENGEVACQVRDSGLKAEAVYYYTLLPYKTGPPPSMEQPDPRNRVASLATAPYGMAGQMYDLLPAIYRRYDTALPIGGEGAAEDRERGLLRRFLELAGGQLDQLHSFARSMLDLHDRERVDGRLLPLLARWIGWDTDYRVDIEKQRNELTYAPYIYERIGIIPTIEATVKRLIGWESRTKEFVHNVFLSNNPERLNLWCRTRREGGPWSDETEPLSLDFAYEGRPAAVSDGSGTLWLFYHTLRNGRWEIWFKTYRKESAESEPAWTPSSPIPGQQGVNKHPAAVMHNGRLLLFWTVHDPAKRTWRIEQRAWRNNAWVALSDDRPLPASEEDRRTPGAIVDADNSLWLFWMEKTGNQWRLKYSRKSGNDWGAPVDFPPENGMDPRVEADPFVLFHPEDKEIWVFWARQEAAPDDGRVPEKMRAKDQTRWTIVCRKTASLDGGKAEWGNVEVLSPAPPPYHDREPAACVSPAGAVELYWSSNRDQSWSVWQAEYSDRSWSPAKQVTRNQYSQRQPAAVRIADATVLIYRSDESVQYTSSLYGATRTQDGRYAGSTAVDAINASRISMAGRYDDVLAYTYDAEKGEQDWYARDAVGIYLTPNTDNPDLITQGQKLIANALERFLPVRVRPVFIIETSIYAELVYTYDHAGAEPKRVIEEAYYDGTLPETYRGLTARHQDSVAGWVWLRSCMVVDPNDPGKTEFLDHRSVQFSPAPEHTQYRTWHVGLEQEGNQWN